MTILKINNTIWIDIQNPTESDFEYLKTTFQLYPATLVEIENESASTKIEHHDNYILLVMHIPIFDQHSKSTTPQKISILATKTHMITVHTEEIVPINDFRYGCGVDKISNQCNAETAEQLLYFFLNNILSFYLRQLNHINTKITVVEEEVFQAKNQQNTLKEISIIKRDILDFRRIIKPNEHILKSLQNVEEQFFNDKQYRAYLDNLIANYDRAWNILDNYKETIESLENTNTGLLSLQINSTIKIFTLLSGVILPATFFLSFVDLAVFLELPFMFQEAHRNYLIVLTISGAIIVSFCILLKIKKIF